MTKKIYYYELLELIHQHKQPKYLWYNHKRFKWVHCNSNYIFVGDYITTLNVSDYIKDALKLAQSGYSFLLPAVAIGLSQKDLMNVKKLENDVLKLSDLLIPLASSYTQDTGEVGRPKLSTEEKSPKTLQNEESLNNQ